MKRTIIAAAALMFPAMTVAAELKVLSTQATEETYRASWSPNLKRPPGTRSRLFSPGLLTRRNGWPQAKATT
jgi:hypothetical protein